ncbi:voltage-dependent calcium channel type A subunit alpha-1 [Apis mellifera caucasica]|nr:voltage-dependent calcium channel type A subunit alpha-1 [Apis mellifera caucasica]
MSSTLLTNDGFFFCRMLGGVGGRHMSTRRRGSSPLVRGGAGLTGYAGPGASGNSNDVAAIPPDMQRYAGRRRRAVTTSDHKSCALVQTRIKLGDIM